MMMFFWRMAYVQLVDAGGLLTGLFYTIQCIRGTLTNASIVVVGV